MLISLAVCGYGAAGALGALTAKDWSEDIVKSIDDDIIKEIRTEITATSVSHDVTLHHCPCMGRTGREGTG